jgi:hypothetical protein
VVTVPVALEVSANAGTTMLKKAPRNGILNLMDFAFGIFDDHAGIGKRPLHGLIM